MTAEEIREHFKRLEARLDEFKDALQSVGCSFKRARDVAKASETARRVGRSRATVYRIGAKHASARQCAGRLLKLGMYNVEEVARLLTFEPSPTDKYLSKPRASK